MVYFIFLSRTNVMIVGVTIGGRVDQRMEEVSSPPVAWQVKILSGWVVGDSMTNGVP